MGENQFFFLEWLSIGGSCWVRDEDVSTSCFWSSHEDSIKLRPLYMVPVCVSSYAWVIFVYRWLYCLHVFHSHWLFNLYISSTEFPEPWEEGFDKDIPFCAECSKISQTKNLNVKMWCYCKNLGRWLHLYKKPRVFQRSDPQPTGNKHKNRQTASLTN